MNEYNPFDIVMQYTVFTSVLDYEVKKRIAREMVRVSKKNGSIIWYDMRITNPSNLNIISTYICF